MQVPTSLHTELVPQADILDEGTRLVGSLTEDAPAIRLIGGVAIQVLSKSGRDERFSRAPLDLDLICERGPRERISDFFEGAGYRPDEMFNTINGHRRLLFYDDAHARHVDVFVGGFSMCHVIPVDGRIRLWPVTLAPADLLLMKLQIVELNPKDQIDILQLLSCFEVTADDSAGLNAGHIAEVLGGDWGLWRTATMNLERTRAAIAGHAVEEDARGRLLNRLDAISRAINSQPKTLSWRLRARLGDRVRWYQEPEEV